MRKFSVEYNCICLIDIVEYSTWCVGKTSVEVRDFLIHFMNQANKVLPDGVHKMEDKGDELLLMSRDVDLMMHTVFAIIDLGTPVRVGIHYGQVCYDEDRCFGADINITSRLQTSSLPGKVVHMSVEAFRQMKSTSDYLVGRVQETYFKGVGNQKHLFIWDKQAGISLYGHPDDAIKLKGNFYNSVELVPFDIDQCMKNLKELREFELYHRNTFQKVYSKNKTLQPLCSGSCDPFLQRHEYNLILRRRRSAEFF